MKLLRRTTKITTYKSKNRKIIQLWKKQTKVFTEILKFRNLSSYLIKNLI